MTPMEVLRGRTPEELAGKFNQREAEGLKGFERFSVGRDEAEESHFMYIYLSLDNEQNGPGEQGGVFVEGATISKEQIDHIHYRLRQIFPKGKVTRPIRDCDAPISYYSGRDEFGNFHKGESNIAFLFPPDPNVKMHTLYSTLVRHGFGTVERLLSFPEDQKIRGFGPKNRQAVEAIKEILLKRTNDTTL